MLPALTPGGTFAVGLVSGRAKKGVLVEGRVWVMIGSLVALGVAAIVAMGVLTVIGASEYLEFAIAMVLFVAILVGSYLFVIMPTPQRRRDERDTEEE